MEVKVEVKERRKTQISPSEYFESVVLSTSGEKGRIDNLTLSVGSSNVSFGVIEVKGKIVLLATVREGEKLRQLWIDRDTGEVKEISAEASAKPIVEVSDRVDFVNRLFNGQLSEEEKEKIRDYIQQMGGLKGLASKMKTYKPS